MDSLICKAKSKQSGQQCKNYCSKGKAVCHIHGGKSTGSKTPEGRLRQKMANVKHGLYTQEAKQEANEFREFVKACRVAIK